MPTLLQLLQLRGGGQLVPGLIADEAVQARREALEDVRAHGPRALCEGELEAPRLKAPKAPEAPRIRLSGSGSLGIFAARAQRKGGKFTVRFCFSCCLLFLGLLPGPKCRHAIAFSRT